MAEMTREEAANLFLRFVIERARTGVIEGLLEDLNEGPPGREPSPDDIVRHRWFLSLSAENQERVSDVIREAVDSAIFGMLVILDGLSGGNPISETPSDFALELQAYPDDEARRENAPSLSVRVNPSDTTEPLHDLFRWKLEETSR
jgi:hypothetical protein